MKVLLVNPPNCGRSIPEERYGIDSLKLIFRGEPLSLEVLAGNLDGHDVTITDLKADPGAWPGVLGTFRPDVIGMTGVTCEANTMLSLAEEAKESSGAVVIVGGVHASCDPAFFNRPVVDYIVTGLGKRTFRALVDILEKERRGADLPPGVHATRPGLPLEENPSKVTKGDLVEEMPPRYDLIEPYREHYVLPSLGLRIGFVASAFGCPHRCAFCSIEPLTGGRYLTQSVEATLRDISLLGDIPVIRLTDANSFGNTGHARRLAEAIIERGVKKSFIADVRADTVAANPELFHLWKKAGLRSVVIGFEEIADKPLAGMEKAVTAAVNSETIGILHDIGITIVGDFIISPGYGEVDFDALDEYLDTHTVDLPIITVLTPLPGTKLFEQEKGSVIIHDLDFYTMTNAVTPTALKEERFYRRYAGLMKSRHRGAKI